jgi:Tetratrico peptide repeat
VGATSDAWEQRVSELWAAFDDYSGKDFLSRMEELVSESPRDSPVAAFELAGAFDATDLTDLAVPLYRQALELGLDGPRRRQAVIQMASSLRTLGQVSDSVAVLRAERDNGSDELDDAVSAFLALALVDSGHEREALSLALTALSRHLPMYQRSVAGYAADLAQQD